MKKIIVIKLVLSLFVLGLIIPQIKAAHRFHTSLTRMDYNQKEKLIEVSIQLFTHDFENVFKQITKNPNDPGTVEKIDEIILKYLNENFMLTDEKDSQLKMVWVGKEFKVDTLDIYIEIPFEGDLESLKLKNTIFFESFQKQINYVSTHFELKRSDLVFKKGDDYKELKFK
jgi:hypothetical protein